MSRRNGIVYYITSHGYGHLNRAAAVLDAIPRNVPIHVKTDRNLFDRCSDSINRPTELSEGAFDCGAVHPPCESSLVDRAATLSAYQRVHAQASERLGNEVEFLRRGNFAAVVSDVAPLPLRAAREAGIPGVLVANFTWSDIFRPYARSDLTTYRPMIRQMAFEYSQATVLLRAQPAIESDGFRFVRRVGLVARRGRDRTRELLAELGLSRDARLVYMYVGRNGQDDIQWQNLSRLPDYHFISYQAIGGAADNWHVVDLVRWPPRDLAASVDVMVAKAGYGTVSDAMTHRTPLVFPPRFGFCEHRALAAGLRQWGGGVPVSTREFKELRLRRALDSAASLRPGPAPYPTDGAQRCAHEILKLAAV